MHRYAVHCAMSVAPLGGNDGGRRRGAGYEGLEEVPQLFVLMGNFCSAAASAGGADAVAARENFNALAATLRAFPRIRVSPAVAPEQCSRNLWGRLIAVGGGAQASSKFVFVPGPLDPGPGDVLPRPPLPSYFTEKLAEEMPSAVFASNPCRVCAAAPPAAAAAAAAIGRPQRQRSLVHSR